MSLKPTFDHDECRRLYATGSYTHAQLAGRYGVSKTRIGQIVNPVTAAKNRDAVKRWHHERYNEPCASCGRPVWKSGTRPRTGLCQRCFSDTRLTATHGTESMYKRCKCDLCRHAAAAGRRARRHANLEATRAYDRARRAKRSKVAA